MDKLSPANVIDAINSFYLKRDVLSMPDAPFGGYVNSFGMILYGSDVSWSGFGGVKVRYNQAKIEYIRRMVYYTMPATKYFTDMQLLHHYFIYLTPANLLADAALEVNRLEGNFLNAVTLN